MMPILRQNPKGLTNILVSNYKNPIEMVTTSGMADAARDLLMAAHMLWDKLWINPSYEKWERLTNDHDLERLQKEHIPSGSEDFHW
jgi:hypothetical protein